MTTTLAVIGIVGLIATIFMMDYESLKDHDDEQREREERMREWVSM